MYRVAIATNSRENSALIEAGLRLCEQILGFSFLVTRFPDSSSLVARYQPIYDFIFLDALPENAHGHYAEAQIRALDALVQLIPIVRTERMALRGYEVDALGALVIPFAEADVERIVRRGANRLTLRQDQFLHFPVAGGMLRLDARMITYIESDRHHITVYTDTGSFAVSGTMKELEQTLAPRHFFRSNHGYLVNLAHVTAVYDNIVELRELKLVVSRSRRKALAQAYADYLGVKPMENPTE